MNQWGVYILQGTRYYIGSTNDIERRLLEHQRGKTHTTKRIGEFRLVKWIPCDSVQEARLLERQMKKAGHYERYVNKNL